VLSALARLVQWTRRSRFRYTPYAMGGAPLTSTGELVRVPMPHQALLMIGLYDDDSALGNRVRVRDVIAAALEDVHLGKCVGGWSEVTAPPNYTIEFEVYDRERAFTLVRDRLREAGVGRSTELLVGRDERYNAYDDTMRNLGPRPKVQVANPVPGPPDMLKFLQETMEEARRKYGGPRNPQRGS
jgi:hypothetical protein